MIVFTDLGKCLAALESNVEGKIHEINNEDLKMASEKMRGRAESE